MKKGKRGVPVIVLLLVFLFIFVSVYTQENENGAENTTALLPRASGSTPDLDIQIINDAQGSGISILLDDGGDAQNTDLSKGAGDDGVQVSAVYLEEEKMNPVLNFFDTLAAGISKGAALTSDQISIVVDENEHKDADVSNEITIDVQDYPIAKSENPAVLIYHTHTREAYMPEYEGQYVACGTFRTDDQRYSVCGVGQRLADQLAEKYGFTVIHDITMNETAPFTKSYDKSLGTILEDLKKNPNINVFIDVHRDSVDDTAYAQSQVIEKDGKRYARVMFVVGRGDDYQGAEAPDWQSNYALAKAVTGRINEIMPGLAREPMVKTKRYNQHLSDKCMLIEVGYDANSITEAENSVDILSQALAEVLSK